jgi:hypothetical protein
MKNFKFVYTEIHRDIVIDAAIPADVFKGEKPLPGSAVSDNKEPNKSEANSVEMGQVQNYVRLLYDMNSEVRQRAVLAIAEMKDLNLVDDLIRAYSVENYTPVNNVYEQVLSSLTGAQSMRRKGSWKAWLAAEAKAGHLKIDYIPILAGDQNKQQQIQSFAMRLGAEHFKEMAAVLTGDQNDRDKFSDALRFMVANDNLDEVQQFLSGDWLAIVFGKRNIDINTMGYFLNGLAKPGPLRKAIDAHIRACLESENLVVVANALHLLAGEEGFSTTFTVSNVEEKVKNLLNSPDSEIALQARRAMPKINSTLAGARDCP